MSLDAFVERATPTARSGSVLDRIESLYLKALRATLLAVATALLLYALGWAAISVMRVLRSPDSVVEKPSSVVSSEIVGSDAASAAGQAPDAAKIRSRREQRAYYDGFVKRYFDLYRSKYQRSLRAEDKKVDIGEFDDLTINTGARLDAVANGELEFAVDRKDLEMFLPVVTEASASKVTTDRLAKYRAAKKQAVATNVQRTRTETRRGWDSFSSACQEWYESPIGCPVTRRVEVPYTERVTVMRYPEGIESPNTILKAYQDRYFALLAGRRRSNADDAARERQEIRVGQTTGWAGLSQSVLVVGAFLTLMFFFLLVAIERHQRRITDTLPRVG